MRSSPSTCRRRSIPRALALPSMRKNNLGRIINIASAHGLVASPFKAAYVAAKHGIVGLTKVIALEDRGGRHHLQRDLPRLRLHAAGRGADRRPGQGARHSARAGDPRGAARPAAEQALRHRRRTRRALGVPRKRRGGLDHRHGTAGRRRLDRALSGDAAVAHRAASHANRTLRERQHGTHSTTPMPSSPSAPHGRPTAAASARSFWCCRAAARSAPTRPASITRCTRPASSPTGSSARRSAPSTPA